MSDRRNVSAKALAAALWLLLIAGCSHSPEMGDTMYVKAPYGRTLAYGSLNHKGAEWLENGTKVRFVQVHEMDKETLTQIVPVEGEDVGRHLYVKSEYLTGGAK